MPPSGSNANSQGHPPNPYAQTFSRVSTPDVKTPSSLSSSSGQYAITVLPPVSYILQLVLLWKAHTDGHV